MPPSDDKQGSAAAESAAPAQAAPEKKASASKEAAPKSAAPAQAPKPRYVVKHGTVQHNDEAYAPGKAIALSAEEAAPLLSIGVVEIAKG